MTWVKLEPRFRQHPKVLTVSVEAAWLYVCGLCYAAENLTDGVILERVVPSLDARIRRPGPCVRELLQAGLWHEVPGQGYLIHDYLHYNPSAAEEQAAEQQRVKAGRAGGHRSVAVRRARYGSARPEATPEATAEAPHR